MTGSNSEMRRLGEEVRGTRSGTTGVEDRLQKLREEAAAAPALSLSVQRQAPAGDYVQRVLFQAGGPVNERNMEESISYAFGNKVRYLPKSGHYPLENNERLVSAFVQLNTQKKGYDTAGLKGMKAVAENVFADASDNIWRAVGEGDARMLVQDSSDDLSNLLQDRRSHSIATASVDISLEEAFNSGDGVLWYDPLTEKHRVGIAVSNKLVFDFENQATFASVDPATVLIVKDADDEAAAVDITNRSVGPRKGLDIFNRNGDEEPLDKDNMISRHLAYMSQLYSTRGEYFQRLKSLLQGTYADKMAVS